MRHLCPVPHCTSLVLRVDKHLLSTDAHKELRDETPDAFEEYLAIARNIMSNADSAEGNV